MIQVVIIPYVDDESSKIGCLMCSSFKVKNPSNSIHYISLTLCFVRFTSQQTSCNDS
jgi:hypothetical protein